jgi:tRNA nucleotidyltransferase (CCA-adding enzyme)
MNYIETLSKAFEMEKPSDYFYELLKKGELEKHYPELYALIDCEQNPEHHPEGNAFVHVMQVVDITRALAKDLSAEKRAIVVYMALRHDDGKAVTKGVNKEGNPNYLLHEKAGVPIIEHVANREGISQEHPWITFAKYAAKHHMRMHVLNQMKDAKLIRFLMEALEHGEEMIEFMAFISKADDYGRVKSEFDPKKETMRSHGLSEFWLNLHQDFLNDGIYDIENEQERLKKAIPMIKKRKYN